MANPNIKAYWRSIPGGTGTNGVTLTAKRMSDSATIASGVTAGAGNEAGKADINIGYPGPYFVEGTNSGTTLRQSSRDVGFIGTYSGADLPIAGRAWTDGVLDAYLNEMAVAAGAGLSVDVATGAAIVLGHPFVNAATTNVTLAAADPSNPRIDRIVLRFYPPGVTLEGKFEIDDLTGTPAGSPSAPALTQNLATVWEISLATVAVAAGASSPGTITSTRTFLAPVYVDATKIDTGTIPALNATTATVTGTITTTGQTRDTATAPTITAGAAAGSTAAISSSTGGAEWGRFVLMPGGTGIAAGTIVTVTFATARPNTDYTVSLDAGDSDAATAIRSIGVYAAHTPNTTGFSIVSDGALTSGTTYRFGYIVRGG